MTVPSPPPLLLLVDDDRVVLSTLGSGLRNAGYRVETASSADEAQSLLLGGLRPHLVLLDVQMPGDSGLVLAERLRHLDQLPFLMLSAYSDAPTVERATLLGALGYLVKPLDLHQILPAIEAALQRASDLRALQANGAHLQLALDAERDVNVAVGITMAQYRLTRSQAFEMLRRAARKQRRKLADLAREIVGATDALHAAAPANPEWPARTDLV
jgi:two-component system, response regulator PdtaR